jgi:hypothetical protein
MHYSTFLIGRENLSLLIVIAPGTLEQLSLIKWSFTLEVVAVTSAVLMVASAVGRLPSWHSCDSCHLTKYQQWCSYLSE